MNNTKFKTKAAKARRSWQLLQEEQRLLDEKRESNKKTIPLKVAHKKQKSNAAVADSA